MLSLVIYFPVFLLKHNIHKYLFDTTKSTRHTTVGSEFKIKIFFISLSSFHTQPFLGKLESLCIHIIVTDTNAMNTQSSILVLVVSLNECKSLKIEEDLYY